MIPTDSFNTAATDKADDGRAKLLAAIAKTRANLALAEAAARKDWAEAARLCDAGADPWARDKSAFKSLTSSDEIAVVDILAQLRGQMFPPLLSYPMQEAAEKGNLATLSHILGKQPSKEVVNSGICSALLSHQDAAADMLLKAIPETDLADTALYGLLASRPEEYERIAALPGMEPDYLMHFINACHFKDRKAIDRSFDKLLAHKDETLRRIEMADMLDMGNGAMQGIVTHVFSSGYTDVIDRFIDSFKGGLLPDYLLLHVALASSSLQPEIFPHIVEKLGIKADMLGILMLHGRLDDRRPGARFLMDYAPEAAKESGYAILRVFASGDTPEEFFTALDKGIPLPTSDRELVNLWEAALTAKNDRIAQHIETAIGTFNPAHIAEMQRSSSVDVMLRAAQLSQDWHARDNALFWRAVTTGRQDVLEAIPREEKLAAPLPYLLDYALEGALQRKDKGLIEDIISRLEWNDDCRAKAFAHFVAAPEWLPLLERTGYLPRPLADNDAHTLVRGGVPAIAWLLEHGYTLDDKAAEAVLEIGARQNAVETVEYMLGRGTSPENAARLPTMIAEYAGPDTLNQLEKWLRRSEVRPAGDIAARSASAGDAFALAVEAVYADAFAPLLQKAVEGNASFDPALLVQTKDNYGNSLLDVLGAHARLNDVLLPALWRGRDAVAFIRDNVPPCYQDQCDFNSLKAALDLERLKDMGKRARLNLKGAPKP